MLGLRKEEDKVQPAEASKDKIISPNSPTQVAPVDIEEGVAGADRLVLSNSLTSIHSFDHHRVTPVAEDPDIVIVSKRHVIPSPITKVTPSTIRMESIEFRTR